MSETSLRVVMANTQLEFPSFRLVSKETSWFMRILAAFLWVVGNRAFMVSYTTTIGTTVYTPTVWGMMSDTAKLKILRHERVHMRQAKKYGLFLFSILYILIPFPFVFAYYRMKFEQEAYAESIRATYQLGGANALGPEYKAFILKQFTTGAYGWMWPFKSSISKWYDSTAADIIVMAVSRNK